MPEPLGPTMATRSPAVTRTSIGPSRKPARSSDRAVESGDDVSAARRGGDVETKVPRNPRLLDDVQTLDRSFGASRPSGELLGLVEAVMADELVTLVGAAHLGLALSGPLPFTLGAAGERRALRLVVGEPLPGVSLGRGLLVEVGLPTAVETSCSVGELVELDDARDRPGEERAVMADDDDPGFQ